MSDHELGLCLGTKAGGEWTMRQVERLLALYFAPDHTAEQHAAVLEGFAEVLGELPRWAVARAMMAWKAQHSRRPTPAELRTLAERSYGDLLAEKKQRNPEPEVVHRTPPTEAEKERVRQLYREFVAANPGAAVLVPESWPKREPDPDELRQARDANPHVQAARKLAAEWARKREAAE